MLIFLRSFFLMLQTNAYVTGTSISNQFLTNVLHDYIFLINKLKQHVWAMYFFILHKFAEIQKDYEGDQIVIYRVSPSEGLMKLFLPCSKWEIIKQEDSNKFLA